MIGFRLAFKQETTLTLRVRMQQPLSQRETRLDCAVSYA